MGFTGIVEEMGTVVSLKKVPDLPQWDGTKGEGVVLTLKCDLALGDAYVGASICINGTCLTVTEYTLDAPDSTAGTFDVNLAPETLRRTNLGDLKEGSKVNLERAIRADGRNSGHNVQGHVDDTGNILEFRRDGESLWVKIAAPAHVMRYVVPKGYIAVDGTSLTVCEVNREEGWFNLMLIAHTQTCVVLPTRSVGDKVNLEVDVLAKYLESALDGAAERIATLEERIAKLEAGAAGSSGQCQAQLPNCQRPPAQLFGQQPDAQFFGQNLYRPPARHGRWGKGRIAPPKQFRLSSLQPHRDHIEHWSSGAFVLASLALVWAGVRKIRSSRKPVNASDTLLLHE
eukprot:gnl/TRDRNA2_/TRDRNA2_172227_c0_seq1.p1 gnl/TRDRNA2_/TRDRNA2_172227_c0~~gnl/TRDRNA2_/TRDRNA2_172227_c0_seq1.p1  ORF type:complete len:343 (-),score=58.29 gnl/TRDRNA2_/TRDRNA2_172227_c0_seq1:84-1112(-)